MSLVLANPSPSVLSIPSQFLEVAPLTTQELMAIASSSAEKYHLTKKQTERMFKTITCESNWDVNATSTTNDLGIVQINSDAFPNIKDEQRLDPYFSLDFIAKHFSYHHESWWVCYNRLFR